MKSPGKNSEKLVQLFNVSHFDAFFQNSALIDKITIPVNVRVCDITFFSFIYAL